VKDMVAWRLSKIPGFPEFEPDWPEVQKDGAASAMAEFLRSHDKELRAFPVRLEDIICTEKKLSLRR